MPLSPADLKGKIEQTTKGQYEDFCRKADKALEDAAANYPIERISVNIDTRSVHATVLEKVMQSYRGAGWDVKTISDQRDGNYLNIKYREPVSRHTDQREFGGSWMDR